MKAIPLKPEPKAYLALFVVYIVWGTTLGAIHVGVETIPPALLVCTRFLVAGLLLASFCLLRGEAWPDRESLRRHFIVGFLLFFGGHAITYWALQHITTALGAALTATCPFWMIWLASIMPPKEKIPPMALMGVSVGFAGTLVLLSPELASPLKFSTSFWMSVIGILMMAFFWCLGSIYARKKPTNSSLLMGVAFQNFFAGLLMIPVCLLTIHSTNIHPSAHSIYALLYLIFIGTFIAYSCYLFILQNLPVPLITTIGYVTPVITLFFGWLFLNEGFSVATALGTVVILAGVVLVNWVNQREIASQSAIDMETDSIAIEAP